MCPPAKPGESMARRPWDRVTVIFPRFNFDPPTLATTSSTLNGLAHSPCCSTLNSARSRPSSSRKNTLGVTSRFDRRKCSQEITAPDATTASVRRPSQLV